MNQSGSQSDKKDLTKSINDETYAVGFNLRDVKTLVIKGDVNIHAGHKGDIKYEDSRKTITALKVADNGATFTTTEHGARNTLAVQTPSDNTSAEETSSSGFPTSKTRELETFEIEEGYFQISDDIFMNEKKPLKEGKQVFEGYQKHASGHRLQIAIKRIVPCTDKHVKEVGYLVQLASHPNIVRIIYSKEINIHIRALYIVMELCSFQNLHDYLDENCRQNVPFDFKEAMSFTKQLVDGMKFIHSNRVLHRDMKPENVLLSDNKQQIKIADFGLGKRLQQEHSITKNSVPGEGTDGYRAPETYKSGVISKRTDVFSVGLTIFGIWSYGKHPFGDVKELLNYYIKENKGRDLSGLKISGTKKYELLDLIDQTLQHDPQLRPTMEEISRHPFLVNELSFSDKESTTEARLRGTSEKEDFPLEYSGAFKPHYAVRFQDPKNDEDIATVLSLQFRIVLATPHDSIDICLVNKQDNPTTYQAMKMAGSMNITESSTTNTFANKQ